jgi:hypothetical protein
MVSLSRNGVRHGRVLGYDTRVNSAKCWSSETLLPSGRNHS